VKTYHKILEKVGALLVKLYNNLLYDVFKYLSNINRVYVINDHNLFEIYNLFIY